MDISFIFKIAAIGIIVAVLNMVLIRSGREEQAMLTTLAGVIVVLMMIIPQISNLFSAVKSLFDLMIKVVGIVLTALIINIVLKNYSKEFTFLINIV